jgi:hypothetical protein
LLADATSRISSTCNQGVQRSVGILFPKSHVVPLIQYCIVLYCILFYSVVLYCNFGTSSSFHNVYLGNRQR